MIEIDLSFKNLRKLVKENYPGVFIGLGLGWLIATNVQHIPRFAAVTTEPISRTLSLAGPTWVSPELIIVVFIVLGAIKGAMIQNWLKRRK